jgi:hypothetical protein
MRIVNPSAAAGPATVVTKRQGSGAGNYTTTSISLVAVDATNLAIALTTPATQMIVIDTAGSIAYGTTGEFIYIALAKDGTPVMEIFCGGGPNGIWFPFSHNYSEIGDGSSHTWALYYLATAGTVYVANSSVAIAPYMTLTQIAGT